MRKQVLLEVQPKDVLSYTLADSDMMYAAHSEDMGAVLIVSKISDDIGERYISNWLYADKLWQHNYEEETLFQILKQMLNHGLKVFEFENECEFADWIKEIY